MERSSESINISSLQSITPETRTGHPDRDLIMKDIYSQINGDKGRFRMSPRRIWQTLSDFVAARK